MWTEIIGCQNRKPVQDNSAFYTQSQHNKYSKQEKSDQGKETQMDVVMDNVGYFLEHLEELLLHGQNPLKQAEYFSLLFEETPTY